MVWQVEEMERGDESKMAMCSDRVCISMGPTEKQLDLQNIWIAKHV